MGVRAPCAPDNAPAYCHTRKHLWIFYIIFGWELFLRNPKNIKIDLFTAGAVFILKGYFVFSKCILLIMANTDHRNPVNSVNVVFLEHENQTNFPKLYRGWCNRGWDIHWVNLLYFQPQLGWLVLDYDSGQYFNSSRSKRENLSFSKNKNYTSSFNNLKLKSIWYKNRYHLFSCWWSQKIRISHST